MITAPRRTPFPLLVWLMLIAAIPAARASEGLERTLNAEGPAALAQAARGSGDPRRGAVLFHRPSLACASCHDLTGTRDGVGPDLTTPAQNTTAEQLVASILKPSELIRTGYESVLIATRDGRTLSGTLAADQPESLSLRDAANPGQIVTIARSEIDERQQGALSLMPAGLADTLSDRQEFLDLARYVIEISEGGRARARALQPTEAELAPAPLPSYEQDLDHAGLIADWNLDSFERGRALYTRVCANCHGTPERAGSLPNSPRFWAVDKLKNGSDPLSLYNTLTRGTGQMAAQSWMVPSQKYDVIHYLRQAFFEPSNPALFTKVDDAYLASLPRGVQRGPEPNRVEPWVAMDYGPAFAASIEVGDDASNIAYKGLAIRLDRSSPGGVSRGTAWALYEQDTMRLAAFWTGTGFIDWAGIQLDGRHEIHPRVVGTVHVANADGPGWANPATGGFDDPRILGRDGRHYGPLPKSWIRRIGRYQHLDKTILAYSVGDASVLESPGLLDNSTANPDTPPIFTRTLQINGSSHDLTLRLGPVSTAVAVVGCPTAKVTPQDGQSLLHIPAAATPVTLMILHGHDAKTLEAHAAKLPVPASLEPLTHGGPPLWPSNVVTKITSIDDGTGPFHTETLTLPDENPWLALVRATGFDFLDATADSAAMATWDGDIWRVDGLNDPEGTLQWRRIASGLFQPLGVKVLANGSVYVTCRDQIALLRDLNADGFTDFYETFNNDQQVTEHFHEFAMGLQTDADGNFYYAKGARHARTPIVPQHGTLLRVSSDGLQTDIVANGFRAPNGVCVNDDGTFFVTDQEGHWTPKNRLNLVREGRFYGNMWSYTDITDTSDDQVDPPVCFLTNDFDRSPAEPIRVPSNLPAWSPLAGQLLSLSYGYGKIFVAPYETVDGLTQGGMAQLPLPRFPTGLIRARFHPRDDRLYTCGMFAWAGNQTQPGGFYRIQPTGRPLGVPVAVHALPNGLELRYTELLDSTTAVEASRYSYRSWSLRRSANYGSPHQNEREHQVRSATIAPDGRTIRLVIDDFAPTMSYELRYDLKTDDGEPVAGALDGTIHRLGRE